MFACNLPRIQDDCIQRLYKQSVENCSKGLSNSHLYKPQFPSFLRAFYLLFYGFHFYSFSFFALILGARRRGFAARGQRELKGRRVWSMRDRVQHVRKLKYKIYCSVFCTDVSLITTCLYKYCIQHC